MITEHMLQQKRAKLRRSSPHTGGTETKWGVEYYSGQTELQAAGSDNEKQYVMAVPFGDS